MVEMAFRAYDPCFGCATHSLPGQMPLEVTSGTRKAVSCTACREPRSKFNQFGLQFVHFGFGPPRRHYAVSPSAPNGILADFRAG